MAPKKRRKVYGREIEKLEEVRPCGRIKMSGKGLPNGSMDSQRRGPLRGGRRPLAEYGEDEKIMSDFNRGEDMDGLGI